MKSPSIVVLISGFGSNLQALIDAAQQGRFDGELVRVISDRPGVRGLERARRAGVPARVVAPEWREDSERTRRDYDACLAQVVGEARPDLVVLAGWMQILTPVFLDRFEEIPVINLHPALPGAFPGVNAIEGAWRAWQDGEIEQTGVMVHRVVEAVDAGPVLGAVEVPIREGDSLEELEARVHEAEHDLLVEVVERLLSAELVDRRIAGNEHNVGSGEV